MNTLYFECNMGASGDMILGALIGLFEDKENSLRELNSMGIPQVRFLMEPSVKCGILGTHISVKVHDREEESHDHHHEQEHSHHDLRYIETIIQSLCVSEEVKKHALTVYRLLADAESLVHGKPVDQIHFHEVGNMDAIADITGACYLIHKLSPDRIFTSPICVGSGTVHTAHGILPVPAPATAELLQGIPCYSGDIPGELCTPTGAAILKYFTESFCSMPVLTVSSVGYGMGKKDFSAANCLRAFWAEDDISGSNDEIISLECNIDDMSGEEIAFAKELLLEDGALDVFTVPIQMKKNRPACLLVCLCEEAQSNRLAAEILRHTTTFGVRRTKYERYVLERSVETVSTPYGDMRLKRGSGFGVSKYKLEYDDLSAAAKKYGKSIEEIRKSVI